MPDWLIGVVTSIALSAGSLGAFFWRVGRLEVDVKERATVERVARIERDLEQKASNESVSGIKEILGQMRTDMHALRADVHTLLSRAREDSVPR